MSELIAEARVLVTPDTTTFRALLTTELAAIQRSIPPVPVAITPVVTGAASTAGLVAAQQQLGTSTLATTGALRQQQAALAGVTAQENAGAVASAKAATAAREEAVARRQAAAAAAAHERGLHQLARGAAASSLTFAGLRGATLAATGPFLAGTAAVIALSKSLSLATSFNSEIAVLGATTGATGEELTKAAAAAREFGRDITLPGVTAGDAAVTITEFAKAGLDLNDSIAATRGGLQLAQAAQLSYKDAVTLTANALNAFNLSGNQAVRVADTLANASNLAQGGIEDTALALRQAAGAAAVVGVSFEDTVALLTLLAQNGLTGSDAGTALRTAFLRLVNPSKEANAVIKSLNINLRDVNGNVRPEVFAEFAAAQRDLSTATQQANAAIVFGQDAFRAFGFLGREGTKGLREVQNGLDETGTAARIAGARLTGLAGAQENLSNQLSSLGETIGQLAIPPLTFFVNELARLVADGNAAIGVVKNLAKELNEFGPGPSATDIFGTDLFGVSLGDVFSRTNPITGVTSPIGQLRLLQDLFGEETKNTANEIKNGGVELRGAIEDAGREAARGAVSFEDQITGAIQDAMNTINDTIRLAVGNARAATIRGIGQAGGQAAGLEEQFDQIIAGGGSLQQQIANLRQQAARQATIIRKAGPDAAGVVLEARRDAQARLASINQQIVGIERQIASEAKQQQDEVARLQEEAKRDRDRAFLQSQEDARTRQQRQVTIAGDTQGLRDDIREQGELRALIQRQIAAIKASSLDEQAKQAALRTLRAERDRTTDAIKELRQADREARNAAREERLDAQEALAQSIFDLTGNRNPLLRAIDAQIREAIADRNAAKKGTLAWVQAKTEINKLLKQRKDLLDDADEEKLGKGKSLAEFLTENAELFARQASNIGTIGVDPFSGFDFSKSIVATTTRLQQAVKDQKGAPSQANRVPDAIDRLIAALERNTAATEGNVGSAASGGMNVSRFATVTGQRAQAMADFWQAQNARTMEQARFDGGGGV